MTLPYPRNAFSEFKQTSRAALIDMAGVLLFSVTICFDAGFLLPRQRDVRSTELSCHQIVQCTRKGAKILYANEEKQD